MVLRRLQLVYEFFYRVPTSNSGGGCYLESDLGVLYCTMRWRREYGRCNQPSAVHRATTPLFRQK